MTITFDTETVLRDVAEQYASGKLTTDEYLDTMEAVCRQHAPFGDAVFVGGVVFLLEVVFEEFGDELPEISGCFAFVLLNELVTGSLRLTIHQFH